MRITHYLALLTTLAALCLQVGCSSKKPPQAPRPIKVRAELSIAQDIPLVVPAFGTIVSNITVNVVPQVSNTLVQVAFGDGYMVKQGQLLYVIDQRSYKAELDKAQAQLKANMAKAQVARDLVRRSAPLLPEKLISDQDFEQLVAQAEEADQAVIAAKADLEIAEINYSYTVITAPFTGMVGNNNVDEGNYVVAGQTNLTTIYQIDPIYVDCFVPSKNFYKLRSAFVKGPVKVSVQVLDNPDMPPVVGTMSFLGNQINTNTGTIEIKGVMDNPDFALWVGQFANVEFEVDQIKNAILVNEAAINIGVNGPYIYVVNANNTVSLRWVQVSENYNDKVVITANLEAGENVVTLGQMNLYDGALVSIDNAVPQAPGSPQTIGQVTSKPSVKVAKD